ncbi:uncharacterized protein LOC143852876 isoform X2 [Tasmannia lanceolata]|uniref:uncharacterized protein LOC143852876 isoform X2 n=1 Tax=Tasmannia lanceolata TaxID=3420 RepID=UPI0040629D22
MTWLLWMFFSSRFSNFSVFFIELGLTEDILVVSLAIENWSRLGIRELQRHIHRQMKGVHRPNIKLKEIHLPKKITRNYVHYHEGVSPIESTFSEPHLFGCCLSEGFFFHAQKKSIITEAERRTSLGNLFCDPLRTFGCHKINAI